MKTTTITCLVFFGMVSLGYSKSEWNLSQLSKADASAKAWLVQVEGDSVLVRSSLKKATKRNLSLNSKQKFVNPYAIYEGDIIVTGVKDRATILLRDGSIIWVDALTVLKVSDLNVPSVVPGQSAEGYKVRVKLRVGAIRVRVPKVRTVQKKFSVQTPQGTASVRGTEQVVQYSPDLGLKVNVLSGLVQVENQSQVQYASRGEKVQVTAEPGTLDQTVNQQRRVEVQKNVQIARDSELLESPAETIVDIIPRVVVSLENIPSNEFLGLLDSYGQVLAGDSSNKDLIDAWKAGNQKLLAEVEKTLVAKFGSVEHLAEALAETLAKIKARESTK